MGRLAGEQDLTDRFPAECTAVIDDVITFAEPVSRESAEPGVSGILPLAVGDMTTK